MSSSSEFFNTLDVLSSGTPEVVETVGDDKVVTPAVNTIFSVLFDILGDAAAWADVVAKLVGLLN